MSNVISHWPGMTYEQRERAISMLTAGISARDVARHFKHHELIISRLLNRFQQTGNVAERYRSGRPRKATPWEDRFFTTLSWCNRFLSSQKLGCLLRNATGTRGCDRTVRNRLHAARLKVCRPYVGILLTWGNYRACCCTVFETAVGIFQHDNASPHTARHTQNILHIHNVNVLQWPSNHQISLPLSTYGTT